MDKIRILVRIHVYVPLHLRLIQNIASMLFNFRNYFPFRFASDHTAHMQ